MESTRRFTAILLALALGAATWGCAPEVGSEAWCEKMGEKDKADWTASEAANYAKHCLIR